MMNQINNSSFYHSLMKILSENWNNCLTDNFDFVRFGKPERDIIDAQKNLNEIEHYLDEIESMYFLLEDERSKEILLRLLAFKILGHRKVRLPLSQPLYFETTDRLSQYINKENKLDVKFLSSSIPLYYADLINLKLPIKLFTTPRTILTQFLLKQYEYTTDEMMVIGAQPGDVVIDGGACWGDATLFFADKVKENGKVLSFEFIPDNLNVFNRNMQLNPCFTNTVKMIEQPLWSESNIKTYYRNIGPGSNVSVQEFDGYNGVVNSITIDDVVSQEELTSVDLIKMDIEGAEQHALKGAEKTLKRFAPKLAIAIYHNINDFANIIHKINDMALGYKFYLGHFTIFQEETVLFAAKL
ncbi:MAG: FkbM family methyltransferase [Candidatus Kryptoniota bacterium]